MRGDGDLYDYCVDDPIGRVNRDGRFWWFIPMALAGGAAIAGLGTWGAAETADAIKSYRTGEDSDDAMDAVKKVAPKVGATVFGAKSAALTPSIAKYSSRATVPIYTRYKPLIDGSVDAASGALGNFGTPTSGIWGGAGTAGSFFID